MDSIPVICYRAHLENEFGKTDENYENVKNGRPVHTDIYEIHVHNEQTVLVLGCGHSVVIRN